MEKLVLTRKGNDVFHDSKKLTIVAQSTKGPGNEVVKIEGLPNANGKKWISLGLLNEGINELTCTARNVTRHAQPAKIAYTLTTDEDAQVKALQTQIDAIIDAAKARYVARPNLDVDTSKMSVEERTALAEQIKKYFNL